MRVSTHRLLNFVVPVLLLLQVLPQSGCSSNNTLNGPVPLLPSSCTPRWRVLDDSTMCAYEDSDRASGCGVSESEKQHILNIHNNLRANVNPTQKNMLKMYWNDDLAALAQKWARVCRTSTDGNHQREVPGWGKQNNVAQSMAWGGALTWEKTVDLWWSQVDDFVYGSKEQSGQILLYIMLARDQANQVGCGHCKCGSTPHFVCNYYMGPNWSNLGEPYLDGNKCIGCNSGTCIDGLCDCGDKVCKNGGILKIANCQCYCSGNWTGDDCSVYDCPAEDDWYCGEWYEPEDCDEDINVPDICPYMCGLCSQETTTKRSSTTTTLPDDCVDLDQVNCEAWVANGECERYPDWMEIYCIKSCGWCDGKPTTKSSPITTTLPGTCADRDQVNCADWARNGECERNPDYMKFFCKKSCGWCGGTPPTTTKPGSCVDTNWNCTYWASIGECENDPGYMLVYCKKSCGVC